MDRYGMIFALLVGVNNRGQTIIFGSAFLSDETIESFVWLFKQFKEVMPDDDPKNDYVTSLQHFIYMSQSAPMA